MEAVNGLKKIDDPAAQLPFIGEILSSLRSTIDDKTALIGFVGTPWTLAAYAMEGAAEKDCRVTKVGQLRYHFAVDRDDDDDDDDGDDDDVPPDRVASVDDDDEEP